MDSILGGKGMFLLFQFSKERSRASHTGGPGELRPTHCQSLPSQCLIALLLHLHLGLSPWQPILRAPCDLKGLVASLVSTIDANSRPCSPDR